MKYRKLRIAWSVAWGVAAVLLIALWVRSYWITDRIIKGEANETHSANTTILLGDGTLQFRRTTYPPRKLVETSYPRIFPQRWMRRQTEPRPSPYYFLWTHEQMPPKDETVVVFPIVLLAIPFAAIAAVAWLPSFHAKFTTRTLLLATTLVAVGLWLIVWLTR